MVTKAKQDQLDQLDPLVPWDHLVQEGLLDPQDLLESVVTLVLQDLLGQLDHQENRVVKAQEVNQVTQVIVVILEPLAELVIKEIEDRMEHQDLQERQVLKDQLDQ
jgi:hypothetical protein